SLALFLLLLIEVFPIIHDAANRRLRCWGNLYKVEVTFAGHLERFVRRQDANLLAFIVDHADFARPNTLVCADKSFVDTKPPFTCNGVGIGKYSMPAFSIQHSRTRFSNQVVLESETRTIYGQELPWPVARYQSIGPPVFRLPTKHSCTAAVPKRFTTSGGT